MGAVKMFPCAALELLTSFLFHQERVQASKQKTSKQSTWVKMRGALRCVIFYLVCAYAKGDKCDNLLSGFACCCSGMVSGTTKATSEGTCQAAQAGNVWMTCLPGYLPTMRTTRSSTHCQYAYSYPVSSSHYSAPWWRLMMEYCI